MEMTFLQTSVFLSDWKRLGLGDEELRQLELQIMQNPLAGSLIKGTGGLRKIRFAMPGRGKSGSARVGYVCFVGHKWTFLLTAFAKNAQANLTRAERNEFAQWIRSIEKLLPRIDGKN
jgi:hypothetical protein